MKTRHIYLLFLFYFNLIQCSTALDTRVFQGCALVNTKIFCYGGYHADPNDSTKSVPLTTHLMMDMALIDFNHLNRTTQPWTDVSIPTQQFSNYVLETRSRFEIAAINTTSYVIHGGCLDPGCRAMLTNATLQYNTVNNTWKTLASPPYTIAHAGMVHSGHKVYMWGGSLANDTNGYAPNIMFTLEMNTATPSWVLSPLVAEPNTPNITRTGHSTTLLEDGRIFYLGGALGTRKPAEGDKYAVMEHATIYNTISNKWDVLNIYGITIAPRKFHTATAVKGSSLIAIYGGIKSDGALEMSHNFIKETCVLLDTETMRYSSLQFGNGNDFPGRYGHSAIFYNSHLLILFGINGKNGQHEYADDISVLDFTDVSHPLWLGNISEPVSQPTKTTNESTTESSPPPPPPLGSSPKLSSGAIAGISVGCAIAGVGLASWIFFLHQRRQKRQSEFHIEQSDPRFSYDQDAAAMSKVYQTGDTTTTGTDTTLSFGQGNATRWSAGRLSQIPYQQRPSSPKLLAMGPSAYQQHQQLISSPIYSMERFTSTPDILEEHDNSVGSDISRVRYKPDDVPLPAKQQCDGGAHRYKPDEHED